MKAKKGGFRSALFVGWRTISEHKLTTFVVKNKVMIRKYIAPILVIGLFTAFTVAETITIGTLMPAADIKMRSGSHNAIRMCILR